jgi:1-acyl-sn-glycerol-3-phosphate acyltransferase
VFSLYWRLELTGSVQEIPARGPLIVAANHSSFLDPWFLGLAFPRLISYLITARWYHRSSLWKAAFRAYGTLPLRPDPEETIRDIVEHLRGGRAVGIFPEGRISPDGRIRRFRTGFSRVAAASAAPVVPVGIRGGFEVLPRTRRIPKPGSVSLHVGTPLEFPGAPLPEPPLELVRSFRREVYERVCRLAGQEPVRDPAGQTVGRSAD